MIRFGGMCLNWKVLVGLGAAGLGLWVVAPNLVLAALPLLLLAACPLSMLLMARGMAGTMQGSRCDSPSKPEEAPKPAYAPATHDQQLAELKAELASVQAQQEALSRQIAHLDAPSTPAVERIGDGAVGTEEVGAARVSSPVGAPRAAPAKDEGDQGQHGKVGRLPS